MLRILLYLDICLLVISIFLRLFMQNQNAVIWHFLIKRLTFIGVLIFTNNKFLNSVCFFKLKNIEDYVFIINFFTTIVGS